MLGMRESYEDWQALGRDLIARGLGGPMLVVADGAPGLTGAIEQCWPASDRQHCVHRARNLYAKVPKRERERIRKAYWQALDVAINRSDAKQQLQALVAELEGAGYTAAAKCLGDDLDALVVHLRYPTSHRRRWRSTNLLERSLGEVKRGTRVSSSGLRPRRWAHVGCRPRLRREREVDRAPGRTAQEGCRAGSRSARNSAAHGGATAAGDARSALPRPSDGERFAPPAPGWRGPRRLGDVPRARPGGSHRSGSGPRSDFRKR
jgi:hypothetical protein